MQIADLIDADAVIPGLSAANKAEALAALSAKAADALGAETPVIFDAAILEALHARERIGATAVGRGIAIPHARIVGLRHLFGLFARLDHPIAFGAPDEEPVDLLFLLLSPIEDKRHYLTALAGVSRVLGNRFTAERLRLEQDPSRLYAILTGQEPRVARA